MDRQFDEMWDKLEIEVRSDKYYGERVYRRLDLEKEPGIRLSVISPDNFRELLIQIYDGDEYSFNPPNWVGMKFDIITLDVPRENTRHISLYLEDMEYKRIFTTVCSDIAETLSFINDPSHRTRELKAVLDQWTQFFKNYGPEGLSPEAQRGLYGELTWLGLLLENGLEMQVAVDSWQGYKSNCYDFELNGRGVEVKTTMTKEPRKVRINNERQLDDRGLSSLYLYLLTLQKLNYGGRTLPDLVEKIRTSLKPNQLASDIFEKSLKKAGYFSFHESNYTSGYILKKNETFQVSDGFPRIVDPPSGIGDISYTITISACSAFLIDLNSVVRSFAGVQK